MPRNDHRVAGGSQQGSTAEDGETVSQDVALRTADALLRESAKGWRSSARSGQNRSRKPAQAGGQAGSTPENRNRRRAQQQPREPEERAERAGSPQRAEEAEPEHLREEEPAGEADPIQPGLNPLADDFIPRAFAREGAADDHREDGTARDEEPAEAVEAAEAPVAEVEEVPVAKAEDKVDPDAWVEDVKQIKNGVHLGLKRYLQSKLLFTSRMKGTFIDQSVLNYARSQAQVYCRDHADWLPRDRYAVYCKTITYAVADVSYEMQCLQTLQADANHMTTHRDMLLVQTEVVKNITTSWTSWLTRGFPWTAQRITRETLPKPMKNKVTILYDSYGWGAFLALLGFLLLWVPYGVQLWAFKYQYYKVAQYTIGYVAFWRWIFFHANVWLFFVVSLLGGWLVVLPSLFLCLTLFCIFC